MAHIRTLLPDLPETPKRPLQNAAAKLEVQDTSVRMANEWLAEFARRSRALRHQLVVARLHFESNPCPLTRLARAIFSMRVHYDWCLPRGFIGLGHWGPHDTSSWEILLRQGDGKMPRGLSSYNWLFCWLLEERGRAHRACLLQLELARTRMRVGLPLITSYVHETTERLEYRLIWRQRIRSRLSPFRQRLRDHLDALQTDKMPPRRPRSGDVHHPLLRRLLVRHWKPL